MYDPLSRYDRSPSGNYVLPEVWTGERLSGNKVLFAVRISADWRCRAACEGGEPLRPGPADSPRACGVKFGVSMMLLTLVIAPILGISVFAFRLPPWPMGVAIFLLAGGGLLRIVHALMFESTEPGAPTLREKRWARWHSIAGGQSLMSPMAPLAPFDAWTRGGGEKVKAAVKPDEGWTPVENLPAHVTATRAGRWLDTRGLEPHSVTEPTLVSSIKTREILSRDLY